MMGMNTQARKPAGSTGSTGGQFAPQRAGEANVILPAAPDVGEAQRALQVARNALRFAQREASRAECRFTAAAIRSKYPAAQTLITGAVGAAASDDGEAYLRVTEVLDAHGAVIATDDDLSIDGTDHSILSETTADELDTLDAQTQSPGAWSAYYRTYVLDVDDMLTGDTGSSWSWTSVSPADVAEGQAVIVRGRAGTVIQAGSEVGAFRDADGDEDRFDDNDEILALDMS